VLSDAEKIKLMYNHLQSYPTTVELEIKPGLTWSQQIGVAIAVLVEDKKAFLVEWVNEVRTR
jgi:hypothetical protein